MFRLSLLLIRLVVYGVTGRQSVYWRWGIGGLGGGGETWRFDARSARNKTCEISNAKPRTWHRFVDDAAKKNPARKKSAEACAALPLKRSNGMMNAARSPHPSCRASFGAEPVADLRRSVTIVR